jgi:8-oxo-dGTP pyrophosphatase MutT (NUDIX family)
MCDSLVVMNQFLPKDEYYKSLATKRVGVAVLFFDEFERLLIVKTNYHPDWQVPGGSGDEGESPKDTAIRETREEIGIEIEDPEFLYVEYLGATSERPDFLEFVFLGGVLSNEEINKIVLQTSELTGHKFVEIGEALNLLRPSLKRKVPKALEVMKSGSSKYGEHLENS